MSNTTRRLLIPAVRVLSTVWLTYHRKIAGKRKRTDKDYERASQCVSSNAVHPSAAAPNICQKDSSPSRFTCAQQPQWPVIVPSEGGVTVVGIPLDTVRLQPVRCIVAL